MQYAAAQRHARCPSGLVPNDPRISEEDQMPTPNELLAALTALTNDWWPLALLWHAWLGVILLMLVSGWRPPARTLGRLTMLPVASVAVVALITGNPFNGAMFSLLAVLLLHATIGLAEAPVRPGAGPWVAAGAALILFGWTYPHFLRDASGSMYLYATPFGILPCPTLSVAIGVTLVFGSLRAGRWSATLTVAGILYGAVGVSVLGVLIDGVLLFGALMLGVAVLPGCRRVAVRPLGPERARPVAAGR